MWTLFVVFVSLCLPYSQCEDSCSIEPVYRDYCDYDFQSCLGRFGRSSNVQLRCTANDENNQYRYEWFNSPDDVPESISFMDPVVIGSDLQISVSTTGYWWCKITNDENLNTQSCSSFIPAIHVYPCTCANASFSSSRICPTGRANCDSTIDCRPQTLFICLETTNIEVKLPPSISHTTPETTETAPGTRDMKTIPTLGIPYHSSSNAEHGVTTMFPLPSSTVVANNNASGTDVLPLLYILGPIVLITLSSMLLLLLCIVCINHRRKKISFRSRGQSNNYSSGMYNGIKMEEHIYDVIMKPTASMNGTYHQSTHLSRFSSSAADYEVPVIKRSKPATSNIVKSTTNPCFLEEDDNQSTQPVATSSADVNCSTNHVHQESNDSQAVCLKATEEIQSSSNPVFLESNGTQKNNCYPTLNTEQIKCSINPIYLEKNGIQNTTVPNDTSAE